MSDKFDFSTLETGFEADWPVRVPTPVNGAMVAQTVMCRLRAMASDEIDAVLERKEATIIDLARVYFVGFGHGESATWSPEYRDRLIQNPRFRTALHAAFAEFNTGASAKN